MNFDFVWILKSVPAVVIGLVIHELAHAYTAYKLGDTTAKDEGRITLNPLKHLEPLGFILIVLLGFGWAKPVTFNPENLKHKHRDEIFISLAGPFSNLFLALFFMLLARGLFVFEYFNSTDFGVQVVNLFILWGAINFGLFVFNLVPIPPLDGSHLYTTFLKDINPKLYQRLYQFGMWLLLIIIVIQNNSTIEILPFSKVVRFLIDFCMNILAF